MKCELKAVDAWDTECSSAFPLGIYNDCYMHLVTMNASN
jgi:hypothetical protein